MPVVGSTSNKLQMLSIAISKLLLEGEKIRKSISRVGVLLSEVWNCVTPAYYCFHTSIVPYRVLVYSLG